MRTILRLALTVSSVGLLVLTVVSRLSSTSWPLEWLANLPVQLLVATGAACIVAAILRARVAVVVCALAMAMNVVAITSVVNSDRVVRGRTGANQLASSRTIGHLNAQSGSIDVGALRAMLRRERPDVFVVLEPTQDDVHSLERNASGYRAYTTATVASPWVRTIVLARVPLRNVHHREDPPLPPATVEYTFDVGNKAVTVMVLHTNSPTTPSRAANRNRALAAAARWARRAPANRVIAGDFNATPWSPEFRSTERNSGLDSSLRGFGQQATWPEELGWFGLPIDHALIGPALVTVDRRTTSGFGSEHRSLLVTVIRAPSSTR